MNDLEKRLADVIREPQMESLGESRITQSLADAVDNLKSSRDFDVEDTTPDSNYGETGSEVSGDWDRPQPVAAIGYGGDYNINIEPITSGYILRVGCQTIAVESGADVGTLVGIYLSGDKTIGDKWMNSDKIVQNFIKENLQVK